MESKTLAILDEAMALNGASQGKVRVLGGKGLVIRAQRGFSRTFLKEFGTVPLDSRIVSARAYRTKRRVVIPDIKVEKQDPYYEASSREGFRSVQSTPGLDATGRVVVTLSTHAPEALQPSKIEAAMLDFYARHLAVLWAKLAEP